MMGWVGWDLEGVGGHTGKQGGHATDLLKLNKVR